MFADIFFKRKNCCQYGYFVYFCGVVRRRTFPVFNFNHYNNVDYSKFIVIDGKIIDTGEPRVMAIVNFTPDSFFESSRNYSVDDLRRTVHEAMEAGADMIDLGGYSSRPGAEDVSETEEIRRIAVAMDVIRRDFPDVPVSVDTFRGAVARVAVRDCGASMINDISGFALDDDMLRAVVDLQVPYILMHMRGNPRNMQTLTEYDDFLPEVLRYFADKTRALRDAGFSKEIIIDPGFGFAKTVGQNYELLRELRLLETFRAPILVGVSRKSMIYRALNITAAESLNGTTALNMAALERGANILRVHDVREAVEAVKLYKLLTTSQN